MLPVGAQQVPLTTAGRLLAGLLVSKQLSGGQGQAAMQALCCLQLVGTLPDLFHFPAQHASPVSANMRLWPLLSCVGRAGLLSRPLIALALLRPAALTQ